MKSKLDLAHEFYLEKLRLDQYVTEAIAWEYAEKMYKEMEENSSDLNSKPPLITSCCTSSNLTYVDTIMTENGVKLSNACKYADYVEYDVTRTYPPEALVKCNGVVMTVEEASNLHNEKTFEVDWSIAPSWANWWCAIMEDGKIDGGWWVAGEPKVVEGCIENSSYIQMAYCEIAPSFNYTGDWKESLQERPEN